MRKSLSFVLVLALLSALFLPGALAEDYLFDSGVQDNIQWRIVGRPNKLDPTATDKILIISGSGAMRDYDYPRQGCVGTDLPPWSYNPTYNPDGGSRYGSSFRGIEIESGITRIGEYAFYPGFGVNGIAEVVVPQSVTAIGAFAFYGQSKLERIEIPASVTSLGESIVYPTTVIVCEEGSAAYQYALRNGISTQPLLGEVKLDSEKLTLEVGETATLLANADIKNAAVSYTYNSDVVSIDKGSTGLVTALKAGSTIVTVIVAGKVVGSCTITVNAPAATPTPTPKPTATPKATTTPKPTATPRPAQTAAPSQPEATSYAPSTEAGYTVKYALAGGSNAAGNPKTYTSGVITLKAATRKGYLFTGWYCGKAKVTALTASVAAARADANGNITLTAHWEKVKVGKPASVKLANAKAGQLTVSYGKVSGAKGYEVQYCLKKTFPSGSAKTVKTGAVKATVKKLAKGKTWYVRVRAWKLDSAGKKVYGSWSAVKSIKIKK